MLQSYQNSVEIENNHNINESFSLNDLKNQVANMVTVVNSSVYENATDVKSSYRRVARDSLLASLNLHFLHCGLPSKVDLAILNFQNNSAIASLFCFNILVSKLNKKSASKLSLLASSLTLHVQAPINEDEELVEKRRKTKYNQQIDDINLLRTNLCNSLTSNYKIQNKQ